MPKAASAAAQRKVEIWVNADARICYANLEASYIVDGPSVTRRQKRNAPAEREAAHADPVDTAPGHGQPARLQFCIHAAPMVPWPNEHGTTTIAVAAAADLDPVQPPEVNHDAALPRIGAERVAVAAALDREPAAVPRDGANRYGDALGGQRLRDAEGG
ncbi:uncharacterized protein BBA_02198 [Beauveria bassiana ARSEF 2860]|uniref:Uncharacterized protein n=1 Tax=Beauveria bassiana (strain ARSEF 2860) TaxID=655819 RepID=J5JX86_BEAB2|nr:uncharacterized protein BBA_02198 [Beauveria bassiana ARSEF 2860]EJP69163.1 hypothetical protein BBA_02198 [Beauveria bassiana ARSEF 2860]